MPEDHDQGADPGFTVKDRRLFTADGTPREEPEETPAASAAPDAPAGGSTPAATDERAQPTAQRRTERGASPQASLPEIDFGTFILSLSTSALYHLGEVPGPDDEQGEQNLPLAKQTIDLIAMLRERTRGNLTEEETQLIDHLLTELRLKFVAASRG